MELINKLERSVTGWLKPLPNLPKSAQKWLAENVWWLALISAILTGISILVLIGSITAYSAYVSPAAGYNTVGFNAYAPGWILSSAISLVFSVVIVVLTALAVTPLKLKTKKGWTLLFIIYAISAIEVVVNAVLSFSVIGFIFGIIFGGIGLAIGGYFLLQIKSYFGSTVKAKHVTK